MKLLWAGSRGPAVSRLHMRLSKLGYDLADQQGVFGSATKKAVVTFQRSHNLTADGIAGPQTLTALKLRRATVVETAKLRALPKVFISYSHADAKWMKRLQIFLAPLEKQRIIEAWVDTRIQPGQEWKVEIKKSLEAAAVAVLLLSQDFIASDFIVANELPPLLAAAKQRRTVILLVLISPCSWEALSKYQTVHPPSKTMVEMNRAQREKVWLEVAKRITSAINK
jgi:putative peptidoglycan binding protein/TIR domain-containing protein